MSTQIGAPVRIVALVGLLGALAMGAWSFTAGRTAGSGTSSSSSTSNLATHAVAAAKSAAAEVNAHESATAAVAAGSRTAMPAAKPVSHAKPHGTPRPAPPAVQDGTSTTIASSLRRHRVVVVLLYDPQAKVDDVSMGEAQAGAHRAHAGFLRVNVLKQRQAAPFAKAYGVLQAPTVLFFTRGGKLVQKLVGFADQQTVTQAALNAAHGVVTAAG